MSKKVAFCAAIISVYLLSTGAMASAEPFTINDAIRLAVQTNPTVGEAAANRRATEAEMHQRQGVLLPQVRLEASAGPLVTNQRSLADYDQSIGSPAPLGNDRWLPGSKASIVVRQLLFDGFASIDEIWRQAARVDAAAARVHERSELTALDAAEAYINVVRYTRIVALANENVRAHRKIQANVQKRFSGGRAGEGDLEQTIERVDAAEAALIEFRRSLADARAKFRNVIGVGPYNLRVPARLRGLPVSKDRVLAVTLADNPTIKAAQSDFDAARYAFHATSGAFVPNISLQGSATEGNNEDNFWGHYSQQSLQVVASWDIFRGGQDSWKRAEASERYTQASMAYARLQRAAYESVDKAWAARTITNQRIAKLRNQIAADRKVIVAYSKEYDLGQRSLIDLLNAQNQLFTAEVSLESEKGVAVFADYQLLAAMGKLLDYLKMPHPVDAEPLLPKSFGLAGLISNKLPPIMMSLPHPGPEPLNVAAPLPTVNAAPPTQPPPRPPLSQRWSALKTANSGQAMSYATQDIFSPKSIVTNMPHWPIQNQNSN